MRLKEMEGGVEGVVMGVVRAVGIVGGVFVDGGGRWWSCCRWRRCFWGGFVVVSVEFSRLLEPGPTTPG